MQLETLKFIRQRGRTVDSKLLYNHDQVKFRSILSNNAVFN